MSRIVRTKKQIEACSYEENIKNIKEITDLIGLESIKLENLSVDQKISKKISMHLEYLVHELRLHRDAIAHKIAAAQPFKPLQLWGRGDTDRIISSGHLERGS